MGDQKEDPTTISQLIKEDQPAAVRPTTLKGGVRRQEENKKTKRWNILLTAVNSGSMFSVGLCFGLWGPALLDLQTLVGTTPEKISLIFTARSAGGLIVMFAVSPLFDLLSPYLLHMVSLAITMVTTMASLWSGSLGVLMLFMALLGAAVACIITGSNTLMVRLWKKSAGPFLQAQHFCFIAGILITPQIVRNFLSELSSRHLQEGTGNQTFAYGNTENQTFKYGANGSEGTFTERPTIFVDMNDTSNNLGLPENFETRIHIPFGIVTGYIGIMFLILVILFIVDKCRIKLAEKPEKVQQDVPRGDQRQVRVILFIFTLIVFLCVGQDLAYGALLLMFTVRSLGWTKARGTVIITVYYCAQVAGRALAIPLAKLRKPQWYVICNVTLSLIIIIIGALFIHSHAAVIWVVTIIFGLSITAIYPVMIQWLNTVMPVTGLISGLLSTGFPLGFMVFPALTGFLFTEFDSMWFFYVPIIGLSVCLVLLLVSYLIVRATQRKRKRYNRTEKSPSGADGEATSTSALSPLNDNTVCLNHEKGSNSHLA